jgi:hypothetical protein
MGERERERVWVCERKIENEFGEEEAVVWGREGEKNENGLREEEEEVVVMFFFETDLMLQLLNFLLFHVKMLFCSFLFCKPTLCFYWLIVLLLSCSVELVI